MASGSNNLIDFNVEESSNTTNECCAKSIDNNLFVSNPSPRLSLENNPFDYVQKLSVCRPDDPFDIVEKEASLKAIQIQSKSFVKTANLLSLSDDSETADNRAPTAIDSNIFHTAEDFNLENESPPITVSSKWSPYSSTAESGGTVASCDSSDSNKEQASGSKTRRPRNYRNRLLKLSISNAVFSTPMSSRQNGDKNEAKSDNTGADFIKSIVDSEASSLDSESPLKFIDDEVKSEEPREIDYDADLELLKIPMLKQLDSPKKENQNKQLPDSLKDINLQPSNVLATNENKNLTNLPDLEALRLKLRARRSETNNQKDSSEDNDQSDISELIKDFKNMICKSKIVDENKKREVDELLETLTSTLSAVTTTSPQVSPKPIVRQSTFDIELQQNNEKNAEQQELLEDGLARPQSMENVPDIMFKSSATYDGEPAEEKEHLNLPQIEPISPEMAQPLESNVKNIIEQLQQFLEQQHLSADVSSNASSTGSVATSTANNPTFIVVMPTVAQNSLNELSQDSGHSSSSSMRRRSQSLSLHDKLKIVQLPIKTSNTPDIQITENYDFSSLNMSAYNTTTESSDFKTPARFLPRRNSFSSTPGRFSRFNGSETTTSTFGSPIRNYKIGLCNEKQQTTMAQRSNLGLIKPDLKKKVRTTNSIVKSSGPLKATLPFKKIEQTTKITSNISSNIRTSTSNTSMHLVAKAGHMSHTSTPMPLSRANGLKPLNLAHSNISTTSSFAGKTGINSMQFSNIANTPIKKTLQTPTVSTAHLRRRTISEFKSKSPIKARINSNIVAAASMTKCKSNLSRPVTKNQNTRLSAVNGIKNKENKEP